MTKRFRPIVWALVAAGVTLLALPAWAQFRGSLSGTVTDPQGGVVAGATVTLTNKSTNQTLTSTTNADGIYEFDALPPAPYQLTVEKGGFKKKVLENVQLVPEQSNALNVQIELGAVSESVVVSAATHTLDTANANIYSNLTANQIQNLPSFGRDVFQLIQLTPGMFGDGAQGSGGGSISLPGTQGPGATGGNQGIFQTENGPQALAGGQYYNSNSYSIDGISTTSAVWGGTTIITPSKDSIETVKVLANNYDAEYGRFSGAQVQVISKSGTNEFHGGAFVTAHRPGLDAYQGFNGLHNRVLRDNNFFTQFGADLGGPIWKNKVFAFFNLETVRSPKAAVNVFNVWADTPAFDKLAPSGSLASEYLTFPGAAIQSIGVNPSTCADAGLKEGVNCVTIPGQGLNIGTPLTTPLGTQDPSWQSRSNPGIGSGLGATADIANYVAESTSHFSKYQYNGRLDGRVTNNDHLAFTLYYIPQSSSSLNGPPRAYNLFHHSQVNEAFTLIWNHIISPSFLNEARVNAAGWRWNEITSNPQAPVGLPTDYIGPSFDTGIGSISLAQFGPNVGSILNQWTYSFRDVATKVMGRHSVKFGGDVTRLFYLNECTGCGVPHYNFFNLWDFLNDAPQAEGSGFNPKTGVPTTQRQDDREAIWGLFVQDDFHFRSNLTLNLGMRYSYFGPLSSKEGNMLAAFPGAGPNFLTGLVIRKGDSWDPQKDNFGPQISFAWSPAPLAEKLVVRGGYGLFYNQYEIANSASIQGNPGLITFPFFAMSTPGSPNPGIVYAVSSNLHSIYDYPANPNAVSTFGANGLPTKGSVGVQIFPRNFPTTRAHHFSLETQYDLGHNLIASVGYQGTLSRNLPYTYNPNAVAATSGYTLNPQINGGTVWTTGGWGNYNAMLLELKERDYHGLMADAQFTWGKSMDTSTGPYTAPLYPYNLNIGYGPSDYNVGKNFKLMALWQPVFFHGRNAWLERIAGGWSISGILNVHSGFPWTPVVSVQGGSLYCGNCGATTLYPASYLGGAGTSTSNHAYATGANFPKGGLAYFTAPTYTAYTGSNYGTAVPQVPGVSRNSWVGPGYKNVDMTLAKAFGIPGNRILGENAKVEFRLDAYNVFNNENLSPFSISNNIANSNFGTYTSALGARAVTLGARFSF